MWPPEGDNPDGLPNYPTIKLDPESTGLHEWLKRPVKVGDGES